MITRDATLKYRNLLGHYKENNAVRLRFDLTGFEKDFPGGKVRCFAQRHGETSRYPVELTVDGNSAYWTVTESDVSIPGNGRCELEWLVDGTVVKSEIYGTMVLDSLKDGPEPPDAAGKAWYEKIEAEIGNLDDLKTEAKDDLVRAINEAAEGELPKMDESTKDMALYNDGEKAEWREQRNPIPDYQENDPESPNYIRNRNGGYYEQGEQFLNAVYPFNSFQIPVTYKNDDPVVYVNVNDTDGTKTFLKAFSYFCEKDNLETVGFCLRYVGEGAYSDEQYPYILEYKDGTKSVRMYDATPVIWPSDFIPIAAYNTPGSVSISSPTKTNEYGDNAIRYFSDSHTNEDGTLYTEKYFINIDDFEWSESSGAPDFYYETVERGWILKSSNYLAGVLGLDSADFPIRIIGTNTVYGSGIPYLNCQFFTKTGKSGYFNWRVNGKAENAVLNATGGDSDIFVVRFTQNDNTWSADKTYAEIKQAIDDGKVVQGVVYNNFIGIGILHGGIVIFQFNASSFDPDSGIYGLKDLVIIVKADGITVYDSWDGPWGEYHDAILPSQVLLVTNAGGNISAKLSALDKRRSPLTYLISYNPLNTFPVLTALYLAPNVAPERFYFSNVVTTPDSDTSSAKADFVFKSADATKTLTGSVTKPNDWDGETPIAETWTYIEADPLDGAVRYDKSQSLTDAQKQQARDNIGVVDVPAPSAENVGKIPVSKQVGDGYKYVMEDKSTSDLSLGLTGTTVGQVPAVKTIDEQGKPTQWEAKTLPEEVFTVNFTRVENGEGYSLMSDKTPEEVLAAISTKKQIVAFLDDEQLCNFRYSTMSGLYFYNISYDGDTSGAGWTIDGRASTGFTYTLGFLETRSFLAAPLSLMPGQILFSGVLGGCEFKPHIMFENLPEVTTSDNGKFMRVVDGMWQAVTVDNANGVSF